MNDVVTCGGGGNAGLDQKMTSDDMMTRGKRGGGADAPKKC